MTIVSDQRNTARADSLQSLVINGLVNDEKRWGRRGWIERTLDSGYDHSGYQAEGELFSNAVRGKSQMRPSFENGLAACRRMDEVEKQISSAR